MRKIAFGPAAIISRDVHSCLFGPAAIISRDVHSCLYLRSREFGSKKDSGGGGDSHQLGS